MLRDWDDSGQVYEPKTVTIIENGLLYFQC